jgi:hypothetical protein
MIVQMMDVINPAGGTIKATINRSPTSFEFGGGGGLSSLSSSLTPEVFQSAIPAYGFNSAMVPGSSSNCEPRPDV